MSCFTSTSKIHPNPPYEVIDPGSTIICPSTPETLRGFEYQDAIDPFRDGLTLLHRQRKIVPPPLVPGGPSVVLVGGFAELLNITSESIVSWTLGRWPDKAGEVPVREAKPVPLPRGDGLIWQGRSMAAL